MAWNGRNESILGTKLVTLLSGPTSPDDSIGGGINNNNNETTTHPVVQADARIVTGGVRPPTPITPKNAWNGRNLKIMEGRDSDVVTKDPSKLNEMETKTSPLELNMAVISKKHEVVVVDTTSSSSKTEYTKPNREDETTNSTSGSSTTNTTFDEDHLSAMPPTIVEGNNVRAANPASQIITDLGKQDLGEKKIKNNNNKDIVSSSSSKETMHASSRSGNSTNSLPTNSNGTNNATNGKQQQHHHVRRSGNNKGSSGSRGNNHNSHNNNNGKNGSGAKVNSHNGGRRRATKHEMPLCNFFLQGICSRGASCTFRHDLPNPTNISVAHLTTGSNVESTSANNHNYDAAIPYYPWYSHHTLALAGNSGNLNNQNIQQHDKNNAMNEMTSSYVPIKRVFDPYKARAIQLAKEAQDQEDRSSFFASHSKPSSTTKNSSGDEVGAGMSCEDDEEKKNEKLIVGDPPFFSIDVECVATGYGSCARGINDGCGNDGRTREGVPSFQYNDRSQRYPGRVAMVDSHGNVLVNAIIRPPKNGAGVLSYLTPLTGLTSDLCLGADALPLEEVVNSIKEALPKNGVIVGQAIDHDVEWLGLTSGKDFDRTVDISDIFRQRIPCILNQASGILKEKEEKNLEKNAATADAAADKSATDKSSDKYLGFSTRYRHFSLRHVCLNLLGVDIQSGIHDPIVDAKYSLLLFHKYRNSSVTELRVIRDGLHRAPVTLGFAAEKTPVIEGVCVSRAGYPYKRAARKIWRWYSGLKNGRQK